MCDVTSLIVYIDIIIMKTFSQAEIGQLGHLLQEVFLPLETIFLHTVLHTFCVHNNH